jgi:hypothetical protein
MPELNFPHDFAQLRIGGRRPFLIIGAGVSWQLVPLPGQLLAEKRAAAEERLNCTPPAIDAIADDALYRWAEDILKQLRDRSEVIPKLRLAEALEILADPRWVAQVGLPLRSTLPRHRVIARFAREDRWARLWSLNWDSHLENALEQIGFDRGEPKSNQPWPKAYRTIITADEFRAHAGRTNLFCILKPHGCVRALIKARELEDAGNTAEARELAERFMITESELRAERKNRTDTTFSIALKAALNESPMMVAGWSISEPYLRAMMDETVREVIVKGTVEELTIADIRFNADGHTKIAECYGLTKEQVYVELQPGEDGFNTDRLFLWIQARYALDQLTEHASEALKPRIRALIEQVKRPVADHFLIGWADVFLPAWVRLCWRAKLVACAGFEPHQLRLELEDEHVPWNIHPSLMRPDLSAAAILLSRLSEDGSPWDACLFPGALWNRTTGRLVLPLPTWGPCSGLDALNPLLKVLQRELALVTAVDILPVPSHLDGPKPPPAMTRTQLLAARRRVLVRRSPHP